ncbi:MAG TPA: sigma-54 dependent transcriptional regulator [Thermoanaerobaculia bacterium]|nr:sigma-54 dependent transcriptional regulator [Thermoanaerobaculia bacterium]
MSAPADRALGRIVIVDDDPFLVEQLTWALKGRFVVTSARDATQGRALCGPEADLYLFDLRLPPSNEVREGLDLLRHARRRDPEATVVMMSGEGERAHALEAIALGAFDFFQKPVDPAELVVILERALERRRLVAENRELRREAAAAQGPAQLIGRSPAFRRMLKEIEKVAASDATVLIQGESGSGKELVARSLHAGSPRRDRAFVAVNVAALPESLAESELFGHEKGAFTGAVASRPGRFELAQGGTLFLDEIGTLSAATQSKLLRAIESREIERVGGRRAIPVDFRLLSATNENLEARVAAGSFREDLFYRINTIPIAVPPLRERPGDLAILAEHFLAKFSAREGKKTRHLAPAVLERLEAHPWRGNVRELAHAIEMLVLFSDADEIGLEDLPRALRDDRTAGTGAAAPKPFAEAVEEYERTLLSEAIAAAGGVKAEAARKLGLDANQIKYLCRKYGL